MEKLVVGPEAKGSIDLTLPLEQNTKLVAKALNKPLRDLVVVTLAKPRHDPAIALMQGMGVRVLALPDGDVAAYLQSLQVLIDRPQDQRLYPTHGGHIDDHHRYVEALLAHRLSREAGIVKQLQGGPKSAKQIVLELYANVAKHLHKPAARSVVAHLRKLHDEGRAAPAVADASTVSGKTVWELT